MKTFDEKLKDYAKLIVKKGINVQKGQPVFINCPVDLAYFVRVIAKESYEAGASEVYTNWVDDELTLLKYENAPMEIFETFPKWAVDRRKDFLDRNAAFISFHAENPSLLKDVDTKKILAASKAANIANKENSKYLMNDINSWCVVSAPVTGWAKEVFPEMDEKEAMDKLWKKIFYTTRCDLEDPIKAWDEHVDNMDSHAEYLNKKAFKYLHYTNKKGTDLKVELPKGHIWLSAGSTNAKGAVFIANIPTEEVYTLPLKTGVNGKLYSAKPLSYNGNLIDEMCFEFKDGKVVNYDAKIGKEYLDDMFAVDENGKYLGEVALVPHDSPISNSNIIFKNTLYDENASCHFAFGEAYPTCLENGSNMSPKELEEKGVNDSLIHVDFMVGTEDLNILGITEDNEEIQIFKDGNWAF